MLTSTPFSILELLMAELHLDPILRAFWEGFPCPPPWNDDLLFRVNWSTCVGAEVGQRVQLFMAQKCNIDHSGIELLPEEEDDGERIITETCALHCKILIACVCFLVALTVAVVIICLVRRKPADKPPTASPSHQTALNNPGNNKYYTSCHYACAPVMARQVETTMRGSRPETRVVNGVSGGGPVTSQGEGPSALGAGAYGGQPPRPDLRLPVGPGGLASYRKLPDPTEYTSSSASQSNSDKSPIYESIGDSDSLRDDFRGRCSREVMASGYCECQDAPYHQLEDAPYQEYHADHGAQTLPLRPLAVTRDAAYPQHAAKFEVDDVCVQPRAPSRHSARSRHRLSSGNGEHRRSWREEPCRREDVYRREDSFRRDVDPYRREDPYRRNIPALHANYFAPASPFRADFGETDT